jgi:hypothetical protein
METETKTCAYCGGPAEGNYTIHRDGFGRGPEVDLCDKHGCDLHPTTVEIWDRISVCEHGHTGTGCDQCAEAPYGHARK